jgi:F-type H+-transporting ATPase subunit delta
MNASQHFSAATVAYAKTLLDLANERQQAEPMAQELSQLQEIVESNPSFKTILSDPAIGSSERTALLEKVFSGNVSPLIWNFLRVLNNRGSLKLLGEIADAYEDLLNDQMGRIEVDVTVAQKLPANELEEVRQRVGKALRKEAVVHQYVDESIIGGLVVRVGDQLIDASVRSQLQSMRQQLLSHRPNP